VRVAWTGPSGEPVVTVTLDRPETRNAQTLGTWRALAAVGDELPEGTRVVVLRGAGPVFSSGIDLRAFTTAGVDGESALSQVVSRDDDDAADLIAEFQRGFSWWHDRDDVITVAAVQGAAVGAGFQLALGCDIRVAAPSARFAMRETSLGLVPDLTGTHPLVRALGYGTAVELCTTGRWMDAAEAERRGLVQRLVDDLDAGVAELVGALLAAPPRAVAATKSVLRAALELDAASQRELERRTQVPLVRGMVG
jgi:enoyl-CoA hydratase/carnithine racemase